MAVIGWYLFNLHCLTAGRPGFLKTFKTWSPDHSTAILLLVVVVLLGSVGDLPYIWIKILKP
jgi:hypothetical protein